MTYVWINVKQPSEIYIENTLKIWTKTLRYIGNPGKYEFPLILPITNGSIVE